MLSYLEMTIFGSFFNMYHRSVGARCSSVKERTLMTRWVVGSILHGGPIQIFLHNWTLYVLSCLLLIGKKSPCGGSGFRLSQSEWSFTVCVRP